MTDLKLCKDCEHFRRGHVIYPSLCARPTSTRINPVSGGLADRLYEPCYRERKLAPARLFRKPIITCGPTAIYFRQAESERPAKKGGAK